MFAYRIVAWLAFFLSIPLYIWTGASWLLLVLPSTLLFEYVVYRVSRSPQT